MKPANKNNAKSVIAYQPPQIGVPQRMDGHFIYVIMYELVLIAALWQHSDPVYAVSLMALTVPLGLSAYLPYRLLGRGKRFLLQLGILTLVFSWFLYRLYLGTPLDKVLAESICGIGLCFVLAQRVEDYDYLLLISFFMLLYGALIPRSVYIQIFVPAFLLMLLLFYDSRARALGRQAGLKVPLRYIWRNWFFILMHFVVAAAVAWYVFILFPLDRKPGEGVFQVSFVTENDLMNHADTMFWFKTAKIHIRPDAKRTVETDGQKATVTTERKKAPVNPALSSRKNTENKGQGNGAANTSEQGTDLVFRVKSPVKLYWAGQIYDLYDGQEWAVSRNEPKYRGLPDKIISESVPQQFSMEKWVSYRLFAAYRAQSFDIPQKQRNGFIFEIRNDHMELLQIDFPKTPFRYSVNSCLLMPYNKETMGEPPPDYWLDAMPRKHFLRLPAGKISDRLKEQTAALIQGIESPYDKAVKLRDFLRENYPYKLEADPLPEDREMADYFVFELKTGHCEYYAGTLAVMARLADLPSRVVTGFSPGNYNALTGFFEVHEYHAHAWTQIFIENMGWLTFDATPPSALPSRTTPFGIGSFRDPFGESWRVTPPEITREAQKYILESREKRFQSDGAELNPAEKILLKTAVAPDNIREQINNQFDRMLPNIEGKGMEKARTLVRKSTVWIKAGLAKSLEFCGKTLDFMRTRWYVLIPLLIMLTALILGVRIIRLFLRRMIHLSRERRYYLAAHAAEIADEVVQNAYLAVREQLVVAGLPRQRNMELIRYSRFVEGRIPGLSGHVERIFSAYCRVAYSGRPAADEEAEMIRESLAVCRNCAYQYSGLDKYFST
jgi:transglutaminase-like putative cysteine protease/energy-coupling factor transporter transmembrane protein EcfT